MNWLENLLPKAEKPATDKAAQRGAPAARAPRAAPRSPVDLAALRRALDHAQEPDQRRRSAAALGRALAEAAVEPSANDTPEVLAAAASHATDKDYALACLARVQTDTLLADVAQEGRFAELRLAAAERITDSTMLDRVARHSRNRDKGVYRHCTEILRRRRDVQRLAQRDANAALALRGLLAGAPLSVTRLLEIERELEAGKDAAGAAVAVAPEVRDLIAQANARVLEEAAALRTQQALVAAAAELARDVRTEHWPPAEERAPWRGRLDALRQAHGALPPWLAVMASSRGADAALEEIAKVLDGLERDARRLDDWERRLAAAEAAGVGAEREPGTAEQTGVATTEQAAPPYPDHPAARAALAARVAALTMPASADPAPPSGREKPPETQRDPGPDAAPPGDAAIAASLAPALDLDALRDDVAALEAAIDAGQLAQAEAAGQRARSRIGSASLEGRLDARLQRAQARLAQLRGWAQWGASKQREQLIAAAQELLAAAPPDIEHLTVAIPALREQWKSLNVQGLATRSQWEKFDRALEQAYLPVAAHRAAEAARRAQARAAKEALLSGWDGALGAIDWTRPDLVAIDALRQQMLRAWRDAPPAGFRDERALRRRLDALIAKIDAGIGAARARATEQREALISAVQALVAEPDLRQATAQAKALQERWRTEAAQARLPRGDEQKLWRRFRAACDVVFERRDGARAEQAARRQERVQAREQRLGALAAALDAAEPGALQRAVAQFRAEWEPARGADAQEAQERRARELLQRAQQQVAALRQAEYRERLRSLARPAAGEHAPDERALAAANTEREDLLLELEIGLDLPSPPSSAEARRRRQVAQLQARFRGTAAAQAAPEELLRRLQGVAAPADAQVERRIEAVIERLVQRHGAAGRGVSS
jgi:hypothetical protein